jgi:predicted phosphodiesterase
MKLHIISDLHTEHEGFEIPKVNADALILAGDIVNADNIGKIDEMVSHINIPVMMVAGNHEYYGGEMEEVNRQLDESSVIFLENERHVIDEVRFLGCTLWTDYLLNGVAKEYASMSAHEDCLNDFRYIKYGKKPLDAYRVREINRASKDFLRHELMKPFNGQTVVITHMLPSRKSIHPAFEDSHLMNASFASDLERYMGPHVDLWVHGHTHSSFDYKLGETRVICNPRGYPDSYGHLGNYFNSKLIVEIP